MKKTSKRGKRGDKRYSLARREFLASVPHVCHYCGVKCITKPNRVNSITVDHVKPVDTHPHLKRDKSNFVAACASCNGYKSNMSYDVFVELLKTAPNRDYATAA